MDYQAILYGPIYAVQGVDALVTLEAESESASEPEPVALRLLDKTSGVDVGEDVRVQTMVPAAVVRAYELREKGITREQLHGAKVVINGWSWHCYSTRPRPSPHGVRDGEYFLLLQENADDGELPSESESSESESGSEST